MGTDKDFAGKKPMMPSSVKKHYKQLFLRFYRAENLPIMDTALIGEGSIDAYAILKYGQGKLKTKVITMEDKRVDWMQEMLVPIQIPIRDDKIQIQIWDQDALMDELCCSLTLSVKSIMKYDKSNLDPNYSHMLKWINLYGGQNGYSGKHTNRMNNDPTEAAAWKGRVLVEYFTEDCKYPVYKIRDINTTEYMDRIMTAMQPR
mmetsp:Transcript_20973/g.32505  ORF Transcript_20973/g.32505 Transcript_20973/m.32505 type:complete len:203 (+) Transcript_20973:581-1189(+)